ncbi:hypothetical protein GCM10027299_46540 [Larkinella ripae]
MKLIVCNKIPTVPSTAQTVTLVFDKDYTLASSGEALQVGREYTLGSANGNYKLFFTSFPIISLNTGNVEISNDENRTSGTVLVADPSKSLFTTSMGIRIRGNTSRLHPKKSYNMELWKDAASKEEFETSLLGMREDSKWLFKAMYNEPLRANNMTSWNIWLKMHQLYYKAQEADALPGIRNRYCDVFINNSYNGVHMLTEDLDRKQLKLKKTKDNGEIRGELYKAGFGSDASGYKSVFNKNELPPFNNNSEVWAGYEMDYPKEPRWNSLFDLTTFVIKSSDTDFKNQIGSKFRLDNLIDYFLFLNAIGGVDDNFGNNQFVARYKENEPYFYAPWDLDVTLGNVDGTTDPVAGRIGTNGLFHRLLTINPNGFKSKMRKRWFALRQGDWSTANFKKSLTDNVTNLTNDGAYKREGLRWPGSLNPAEHNPVLTWIEKRLAFLDQYFGEFPDEDPSAVEINLQGFTAQAVGSEKLLQWTTSLEKNAARFEVEFSANGSAFAKVGQVTASGNSTSEKAYQFTHPEASAVAYYRLKVFNKDELYTYSPVVLVGNCPSPPAVPTLTASVTAINAGQSQLLKAAGCANTVVWNTGQTGTQITVTPTTTTSYQARCRETAGCESDLSNPLTIKVNVQTAYDGYLSTASCSVISGWAWDSKKPNDPVLVEILDGQTVVATALANIYRSELQTAGKGNGIHAYAFETPKALLDNKSHVLSARVQGSTTALKQSPRTITCPLATYAPQPPTIAALAATINKEFSWSLPTFTDLDYATMSYSLSGLPAGLTFAMIGRKISGIPTESGTFNLVYSANDGQTSNSTPVKLVVSNASSEPTNQPPAAPTVSPLSATVNAAFSATLPGFTDSDPLTYSLDGLPNGLGFAPGTRQISGIPTVSGTFSLTYSANDGQASETALISLVVSTTVVTPPANQPPQAPAVSPLSATINAAFTATLPVFADTDPLTYALAGLPNGLNFNAEERKITGTPTETGPFSLTYSANDGQASNTVLIALVVSNTVTAPPTNQPPAAPTVSPLSATVNAAFSATLPEFSDSDPLTYALAGLPGGLIFTASSRKITGSPTTSGTFSLTYTATDSQAASTAVAVAFTISPAHSLPSSTTLTGNFEGYLDKVECGTMRGWVWDRNKPNTPLTVEFFINDQSIGTASADIFRQDLKDAGKGNGAHAYSFTTPGRIKNGTTYQISARVQNSNYILKGAPKALNCPVEGTPANQPPQAPSVNPLAATVNASFSATLPVFTDTDPLTYALSGLPGGLNFNAGSRQISGSPTETGTFTLTYSATDNQGGSNSVAIVLKVSAVSSEPQGPVTGNFDGYLDKVECGSIRGWVWDRNKPNAALTVEFFANNQSIGETVADIFRQDLKNLGKGNGAHVYSFTTPASIKNGTTYQISAKVKNSNYVLSWSPKPLNCPSGSRVAGEGAEAESVEGLTVWPNPSNGQFEVHYRLEAGSAGELSILDASGRGWYRKTVEGEGPQHQKVSLSGAQGIFIIQLQQGKTVKSKKIIINP